MSVLKYFLVILKYEGIVNFWTIFDDSDWFIGLCSSVSCKEKPRETTFHSGNSNNKVGFQNDAS